MLAGVLCSMRSHLHSIMSEGGGWWFLISNYFRRSSNTCTFHFAAVARYVQQTIDLVMDDSFIVDSVALNNVPYPSWPRVVPPPSVNGFSYYAIKFWRKFSQIFLPSLVLLCHRYMALVYRPPHFEILIIAQLIKSTLLSLQYPYGCAMGIICTSSVARIITYTGWLQSIQQCRRSRAWYNSCSLGVP